ncbi:hypothetical protein [Streptomyces spongiicola]|nr:hypothetical protein [Streptomyces spongiicola]
MRTWPRPCSATALCATAIAQPGRVTILTSDVEGITMLTTDHIRVTAEKI